MRLFLLSLSLVFAVGVTAPQASEPVFGQTLMSAEEITAYKNRLAECTSAQERTQVESEHKDRMVQRARWKGQVIRSDTMTMAGND